MFDDYTDPEELIETDEDFEIELSQLEAAEEVEDIPPPAKKSVKEATCGDIEDEYLDMLKKKVPQDQIFSILARKYGYSAYEIEMIVL